MHERESFPQAHRGIGAGRGGEKSVVVGITPTSPVVAAAAEEHLEEVDGVGEVGGPTVGGDRVVERLLVLKPRLLLQHRDGNADAQFTLPGFLDDLGDYGLLDRVAHLQLKRRQVPSAGKPGFGEQTARGGKIRRHPGPRSVTSAIGRGEMTGRRIRSVERSPRDAVAVEGEGQRPPELRTVEGGPRRIEPEPPRAEKRIDRSGVASPARYPASFGVGRPFVTWSWPARNRRSSTSGLSIGRKTTAARRLLAASQ